MPLLRTLFAAAALLIAGFMASPSTSTAVAAERKPNVIIIYSDDQGSIDTNAFGATDLATPNLDDLARRGVRFTQMLAPAPICSASRAGLLTGRFPVRAGVPGNVSSDRGTSGMPPSEVTIADMLQGAGYATSHIGKWHLGYTPETMPQGQGFDESFGHMGGCIDNYSHYFYWSGANRHDLWRNGQEVWADGRYFPDMLVEEATRFVETHRDEPFFIYWALNIPHYPLQGTAKWREHYAHLESPRDKYAALVSTMDEKIGELLAKLDELELRDDTLIIFQSDHGHSTEERTFFGGGNAGPYRGAKSCLFEGGLRVPSIVSCPGRLPQNEVREQFVTGCDWLPTIAELCEVPLSDAPLDGRSIVEVINSAGAPSPHESFYWQYGRGDKAQWAVREGDWKLLGNPRDSSKRNSELKTPLFLSNMAQDVGESKNLAEQHPEVVERLLKLHEQYVADVQENVAAQ